MLCCNIGYAIDLNIEEYIPISNTVIFDIEAPRNENWLIPGKCEAPDIEESSISNVFSNSSISNCFYIKDSSMSAIKTYSNI